MKRRISQYKIAIIVFVSLICVFFAYMNLAHIPAVFAANMNSVNYSIDTDSVNFGGTENSSSVDYIVSDTLGELGTGFASSTNYGLYAGYRILQSSYISISASPDVVMTEITGLGGEESNGNASWTVITDNIAGYEMYIRSETEPALMDAATGAYFGDYTPSGAEPDYFFTVAADESAFGFSVEGNDIADRFKDDGENCNGELYDTQDRCWDGLSTSEKTIARRESSNHPHGTVTTVKYQVAIGAAKIQDSGAYASNISVTAITL